MEISFHRSRSLSLKITKPGEVRAFVFDVVLGVTKVPAVVDPLSGMLVELPKMDEWLTALQELWKARKWDSWQAVLNQSVDLLKDLVRMDQVVLHELLMTEKRGFIIGWRESEGHFMGKMGRFETQGELYQMKLRENFNEARLFEKLTDLHKSLVENDSNFNLFPDLLSVEIESYTRQVRWVLDRG